MGGDYTLPGATVIALLGVVFPPPALNMSAICQVSRGTPAKAEYVEEHIILLFSPFVSFLTTRPHSATSGQVVKDADVWAGPVTPYDGRPVAQSDSLSIAGLCIVPAGRLADYMATQDPDGTLSYLTVAVVWQANQGDLSRESQGKGTFRLYGPLDMASSIVEALGNEADGREMRVAREQSVRVTLFDKQGRNRVGGEDADLFFLDFVGGPSSQPQVRCARVARPLSYSLDALSLSIYLSLTHARTHRACLRGSVLRGTTLGGREWRHGQAVPLFGMRRERARFDVRLLRVPHVVRLRRHLPGSRAGLC
jgi:hypothetical protein